jgi:histidinol-phosphate phosphatase family protein
LTGRFAVFLDRDGTVMADRHFLADPAGVELLPGAAAGLRRMRDLGAALVVVTNQSGVGRGYFDLGAVERVNDRLRELLAAEGIELDGIYVCPHGPDEGCACRKPEPGLFLQARDELGLDLGASFVVGDREVDVEAGRRLGATPIRIGREAEDLSAAADLIETARS